MTWRSTGEKAVGQTIALLIVAGIVWAIVLHLAAVL